MRVPYPAVKNHGLIGDRRTAALIGADGTIDWFCLPDYGGTVVFGSILDFQKGGYWRLGPACTVQAEQHYIDDTCILETRWALETGIAVSTDAMLWPETERPGESENSRALVRHLRCVRGKFRASFDLQAAADYQVPSAKFSRDSGCFSLNLGGFELRIWASCGLESSAQSLKYVVELGEGEEIWTVLDLGTNVRRWSVESARNELERTQQYWRSWLAQLGTLVHAQSDLRRSALVMHQLTFAPQGSVVAAPTASLPERIGGTWNADYRFSWVRDASLALGTLARLGDLKETERYLKWLSGRMSPSGPPLQVLYEPDGGKEPKQRQISNLEGYRGSQPVRFGNHAYTQRQFGSYGFLADCLWIYLQEGGPWREEYWQLIHACADYVAQHWSEPDNGIWELSEQKNYVHSKVLCWVILDRAIKIARKLKKPLDSCEWEIHRSRIHDQVMEKGWSKSLGSFRQAYESETLDAAELLISVMGFLPGTHPRVLATIDRIADTLTIDGYVYRFNPLESGVAALPLGEFEGAFLPSTCWLATAYAKAGNHEKARSILAQIDRLAGDKALLPEAIDPRTGSFRGNTPLLFSHAEYVRAKLELLKPSSSRPS